MTTPLSATRIAEQMFTHGATMDEVIAATGGPQYNVLRRLEAKGYGLRKVKEGKATRYFVTPPDKRGFDLTVSERGQIVLPKDMRTRLGIVAGGILQAELDGDCVVLKPKKTGLTNLFGILHRADMPAKSLDEIDQASRLVAVGLYREAGLKK